MFIAMIVALFLVFPAVSVLVASSGEWTSITPLLILKWFGFWAVGVRLMLAGLRQIVQPDFTAKQILGLQSSDAAFVVRELGFANVALGCVGIGCVFSNAWVLPAAVVGAVFYGLATINHARQKHRGTLETVVFASDAWASLVLVIVGAIYLV